MFRAIVSILAFQAAWGACAYGAVYSVPYVGIVGCLVSLGLGVLLTWHRGALIGLAMALGLYGLIAESMIISLALVSYSLPGVLPHFAPVWIVALWMAYATLIEPAFGWLKGRPWVAGVLGAVMGPVAYYGANRLGALQFGEPEWGAALAIGLMWGVAMPLSLFLSERFAGRGSDPASTD